MNDDGAGDESGDQVTAFRTTQRLFLEVPLTPGRQVALNADQSHYVRSVLRCREGDPLRLFNGHDGEYLAHVAAVQDTGRVADGGGRGNGAADLAANQGVTKHVAGLQQYISWLSERRDGYV